LPRGAEQKLYSRGGVSDDDKEDWLHRGDKTDTREEVRDVPPHELQVFSTRISKEARRKWYYQEQKY
jgi:hypothetical protein